MKYKSRSIRLSLGTILLLLLLSQCAARRSTDIRSKETFRVAPPLQGVVESIHKAPAYDELVADLISTGKKLLGKPYRYKGSLPWSMDCSGFVCYLFAQYDISLPRSSAEQAAYVEVIDREDILPGDLLFFKGRNRQSNRVGHVAMVIDVVDGDPVMMHSTNSRGIIIERLSRNGYFSSRYLRAGRVPEMSALVEEGSLMVPEPRLLPIGSTQSLKSIDINRDYLLPEISLDGSMYRRN